MPRFAAHVSLLLLLMGAALALRVSFSIDAIFLEEHVRFRGTDAWYHMRMAENTVANFPHRLQHDPLLAYPGGGPVLGAPLFDQVLASLAWATGFGHPSTSWIETLGAWFPAILGGLAVIPVFFLANFLGGRPAGLIAATLIACMPGRFLLRSLLGATDHHVMEVLLSTCCLLSFAQFHNGTKGPPIQGSRHRGHGRHGGEPKDFTLRSPWFLRSVLLAGLSLGLYLLSWRSGIVMIAVLVAWLTTLLLMNALRSRPTENPALHTAFSLIVALLIVAPFTGQAGVPWTHVLFLMLGALSALAAFGVSRVDFKSRCARIVLPLGIVASVGFASGLAAFLWPQAWSSVSDQLQRLVTVPWAATVSEMRPWLLDTTLLSALWQEFTLTWVFALAGMVILLTRIIRTSHPGALLVVLWTIATFALSLAQRRFTYYLAAMVAVLAALAAAEALRWLANQAHPRTWIHRLSSTRGRRIAMLAGILLLVVAPNLKPAIKTAQTYSGPSEDWLRALSWLRHASPSPPSGAGLYLASGTKEEEPMDAGYGVLSWWDRGYWILRLAHRAPIANPTGHGAAKAASFFLAEDEGTATRLLQDAGGRYVIVDDDLPVHPAQGEWATGDLASMPLWVDQPPQRYFERFEIQAADGTWNPLYLYYPSYYRTIAVHLETFAGQAVGLGASSWEVSFQQVVRDDGVLVKRITKMIPVRSLAHATRLMTGRPYPIDQEAGVRLASSDPRASCTPLPALKSFRLVYPTAGQESSVQIFQFDEKLIETGRKAKEPSA